LLDLQAEMLELPTIDTSLQLPLPRLLTPDLDRLLVAIEEDDLDGIDDALPAVLARVDTPWRGPSWPGRCSPCATGAGSIRRWRPLR